MSPVTLPLTLPGCAVDEITTTDTSIVVVAHPTSPSASCPNCGYTSTRVHSHYTRRPLDLPVSDKAVRLRLHVRRFFCDNARCSQRTFVERLPDVVAVRAQRTTRLIHALQVVAFALGGQAAARVVAFLHMDASADTLLRVVRRASVMSHPTPRVLGVDDFAYRKGCTYGTLLVDLERHHVVDMLEDRTADTLAKWLRHHPGVEWISRDRSTEYARGATEGAPTAAQIADRWHLLQNLRQALQRLLSRMQAQLLALPQPTMPIEATNTPAPIRRRRRSRTRGEEVAQQASRARRYERYEAVRALHQQGVSIVQIGRQLQLSPTTVRKFVYADAFPERAPHRVRTGMLAPYEAYLSARLREGCRNASQLWREIQAQGFPGSPRHVIRWVHERRDVPDPNTPKKHLTSPMTDHSSSLARSLPSSRQLAWLLVLDGSHLDADQSATLARIRQAPEVETAYHLAQRFQGMVCRRRAGELDEWLKACDESKLADLQTFAAGLRHDYAAVRAALAEPFSNGQLEGQINRLKMLKRQMYGRAHFDLLRRRVLQAA